MVNKVKTLRLLCGELRPKLGNCSNSLDPQSQYVGVGRAVKGWSTHVWKKAQILLKGLFAELLTNA